jgi:hypothetical protein
MVKRGINDELREINVGGVSAIFFRVRASGIERVLADYTGIKKERGESEKDIPHSLKGLSELLMESSFTRSSIDRRQPRQAAVQSS